MDERIMETKEVTTEVNDLVPVVVETKKFNVGKFAGIAGGLAVIGAVGFLAWRKLSAKKKFTIIEGEAKDLDDFEDDFEDDDINPEK